MNAHANPEPAPEKQTVARDLACTIAANTTALAIDFTLNGGPYGIALAAEATVKKPTVHDLLKLSTWRNGYANTWGVLKYGFYPTFLLEVALSEAGKQVNSAAFSNYSDMFMPTLVGMGTAPAVSVAAINERFQMNQDLLQVIKQKGLGGLKKISAGATPIGLREGLCYYALHHDTSPWATHIASVAQYSCVSFFFSRQDGQPTLFTKSLVSLPDVACVLAGQPLTVLAVNAAITKFTLQQQPARTIGNTAGYFQTRLLFWELVCNTIIAQGKKSGLSPIKSFLPGTWLRTASLLGTVGVFKTCLEPTKSWIHDNITHRQLSNKQ